MMSAREWLDAANWETSPQAYDQMCEIVGKDKTDEFVGTMDRLATNILYTLDTLMMTDTTMRKFITFASAVAIDNVMPRRDE